MGDLSLAQWRLNGYYSTEKKVFEQLTALFRTKQINTADKKDPSSQLVGGDHVQTHLV